MRAIVPLIFLASVVPITLAGCPEPCGEGCFADDGPSGPSTQVQCVDAPAPAPGAPVLVFGQGAGDAFTPFGGTVGRQLDYGDQGGQHFYVTVRWYGGPADGLIVLAYDGASNNHGVQNVFNEPACTGWLEASTYVQIEEPVEETGTLHAEAGRCAASGCPYDELTDRYVLDEVLAEADQTVAITP